MLEWFLCRTWEEIIDAIRCFESRNLTWGMRTDVSDERCRQGLLLPFIHKGNIEEAHSVWCNYGRKLEYIVSKNITSRLLNGVSEILSLVDETIFIEFSERDVNQRRMYDKPANVKQAFISPYRRAILRDTPVYAFSPEDDFVKDRAFDVIYQLSFSTKMIEVITFTVMLNRGIVIW